MASEKHPIEYANNNPYLPPVERLETVQPSFDFTSYLPHPLRFQYTFTKRDYRQIAFYPLLVLLGLLLGLIALGCIIGYYFSGTIGALATASFVSTSLLLLSAALVFSGLGFGSTWEWMKSNRDLLGPAEVEIQGTGIQFAFAQTSARVPWEAILGCQIRRGHVRLIFDLAPVRMLVLNQACFDDPSHWDHSLLLFKELASLRPLNQMHARPMKLMQTMEWKPLDLTSDPQCILKIQGDVLSKDRYRAQTIWPIYIPFIVMASPAMINLIKYLDETPANVEWRLVLAMALIISIPCFITLIMRLDRRVAVRMQVILKTQSVTFDTPVGVWTHDLKLIQKLRVNRHHIRFRISNRGPLCVIPKRFFATTESQQKFLSALAFKL